MSRARTLGPVIAILNWTAAATLKGNAPFLRRAGLPVPARARRDARPPRERSLLVRAGGAGELQRFLPRTVARRLRAGATVTTIWTAETRQRG